MDLTIEKEIRRALEAGALSYEPPHDLRDRILTQAEGTAPQWPKSRIRAWKAARLLGVGHAGARWVAVGTVVIFLAGLYGIGYFMGSAPGRTSVSSQGGESSLDRESQSPSLSFGAPAPDCDQGNCGGNLAGRQLTASNRRDQGGNGGSGGDGGDGGGSGSGAVSGVGTAPSQSPTGSAQSIVRTGEVEIRIKKGSFSPVWDQAMNIAARRGGFVAASSAEQAKGRLARGTLTLRIPATSLDATVADFRNLGKPVRVTTSSSDVGGQLVDQEARIRSAQARELQLLELLKQSKSLPDSLQVSTPLAEVRTQIETLQAQRANLQNQVDLATLTVGLHEPQAAVAVDKPATGWLAKALQQAGNASSSTISTILVGAGLVLPLVVLALIAWTALRFWRRNALR